MYLSNSIPCLVLISNFSNISIINACLISLGNKANLAATNSFCESSTYFHNSGGNSCGLLLAFSSLQYVSFIPINSCSNSSFLCGSSNINFCSLFCISLSLSVLYIASLSSAICGNEIQFGSNNEFSSISFIASSDS